MELCTQGCIQFVVESLLCRFAKSSCIMTQNRMSPLQVPGSFLFHWLPCLAAVVLVANSWAQLPNPPPRSDKPNIILIVADDLGYGDLGCYGQKQIQTPNIDRLATNGMRFTSFYAGSTVCAPSRCSLMTGMHTGHATIRGNIPKASLAAGDISFPQLLHPTYNTGLVGKWGLGDEGSPGLPNLKGFIFFGGYLNQTRAHDYYAPYLDRFDTSEGLRRLEVRANVNAGQGSYLPDMFQKYALNFIRINRPAPFNPGFPFLLVYTPTIPHANNELGRQTGNGMQVPDDKPYSGEDWPQAEKNKAAMITRLDSYVGEILAQIEQFNQVSNTLILFTSDNGAHKEGGVDPDFFHSSGPLRGIKRDLYEGGVRVPMLAVWPGKISAGQVSDEPWAFWDLLPTLCEIGGAKIPKGIDGISYLPTLLGQSQTNRHEYLYWELHESGFKQAVRAGDWKAVRVGAGMPLELYNLSKDLGETKNVAAQNPDVVTQMEEYLKSARTDTPPWNVETDAADKPTGSAGESR